MPGARHVPVGDCSIGATSRILALMLAQPCERHEGKNALSMRSVRVERVSVPGLG